MQGFLSHFVLVKMVLDNTGKTVFYSIQYKNLLNTSLDALDLFPLFAQLISIYSIVSFQQGLQGKLSWFLS